MRFKNIFIVTFMLLVCIGTPLCRDQQTKHEWDLEKIEEYKQSVTIITTLFQDNASTGAGVVIRPDGLTLTAAHLFRHGDIQRVIMQTTNGNYYEMVILAYDNTRDLALIRPTAASPTFKYAQIQTENTVDINSDIIVIGHPLLQWFYMVEKGVILAVEFDLTYMGEIEKISALIRPGNSGGPVISTDGKVIGIVSAVMIDIFTRHAYYGIAISIKEINKFLEKSLANERYWPKQIKRYRMGDIVEAN